MHKNWISSIIAVLLIFLVFTGEDCENKPASTSGVNKTSVTVPTGSDGLTVEQRQVGKRLLEDNKPGAIKHLYIISAYSGQVLIYSTVQGKVTSSGKRLSPTTINGYQGSGFAVQFGNETKYTDEVLQDDGTYGTSVEYVYWWDVRGVYHQQYITGGMLVHVASQPLAVKNIVLNMELAKAE